MRVSKNIYLIFLLFVFINIIKLHSHLFNDIIKDVRDYDGFTNAANVLGSSTSNYTLAIAVTQNVHSTISVPTNITLKFLKGGRLIISSGVKVFINTDMSR